MSRSTRTIAIAAGLALAGAPAMAQGQSSGAFQRAYPEAAAQVQAFGEIHADLLDNIFENPSISTAQLDGDVYQRYLAQVQGASAMAGMTHDMAAMPNLSQGAPQVAEILHWAHTLQNDLYDILADPSVGDRDAAVSAAIDRYLARSDLALPAEPTSMMIMHGQEYSMMFMDRAPKVNGLVWANHWLQLALFDPLLFYKDPAARQQGIQTVLNRFNELLANPPESYPREMPTPAAITPELVRHYPRAAAIFDNVNMLHDIVADILVDADIADKSAAIGSVVADFRSPTKLAVSDYDWIVGQLRHGIYYQGGPAIGRLDRPERNMMMDHGEGGMQMVMPGMPQ